jgi:hypothetical protein
MRLAEYNALTAMKSRAVDPVHTVKIFPVLIGVKNVLNKSCKEN